MAPATTLGYRQIDNELRPLSRQIPNHLLLYSVNLENSVYFKAAKIMLYLFHYGEAYASAIANDMNIIKSQVIKQLNKFEEAGILVSKSMGKVRIYTFNPKLGVTKKLKELIQVFYEAMPFHQREELFSARRRPRRKGKPVISKVKNAD